MTSDPKTAAMFRVLEQYHLLFFESKVSAYEFYHSLRRMSDNTSLLPIKHAHTQGRTFQLIGKILLSSTVRWLYALFLTIDTNFWLKCKAISNDNINQSLSRGWGYFVEEGAYKDFLCSSVDSIQEVLSTAHATTQNGPMLWEISKRAKVPHTRSYQAVPNLILIQLKSGVGRTDGEAPEHGWANINPISSSTKEMGPGAQRDTLDNYFGDLNWKKSCWTRMHYQSERTTVKHSRTLTMVCKANMAPTSNSGENKCRLGSVMLHSPILLNERQKLAREDQIDLQTGTCLALHEDCTPSVLISTGLELEEQQAGLGVHATDNQEGKMLQWSNTLQWRINTWVKMQELYMPFHAALHVRNSESSVLDNVTIAPEVIKLLPPSQISRTASCDTRLQSIKWKLQYAQAHDAR
ncbi:hypothetical protein F4604DRAFT_1686257 [Suillus subluteus]|nr:hypothetical protein F4604DRAFT_1686257 [Suillus subluteus]